MSSDSKDSTVSQSSGSENSSGGAAPTSSLNLPKGGGAIRGMGEKFSVNAATGTTALSVPIFTSPGRPNGTPTLSLSYNSGSGNGPFGLGWQLSLPAVARKTDKGLPFYDDARDSDIFILSDAEDLMPALVLQAGQWVPWPIPDRVVGSDTYKIRRYRPRMEGGFVRVERWQRQSDGDLHWRVTAKDNITSVYGQSPLCRLCDPAHPSNVFKWLLERTFDDKGNVVFFEYKVEDASGIDPRAANEQNRRRAYAPLINRYLKRIHYGPQKPYQPEEDLTRRTDWLFEVVLDYGEHNPLNPASAEDPQRTWNTRADPFSNFRSTFEIRTYRLCQRVLMFHHFPALEPGLSGYDGLVRSTDFSYAQADPNSPFQGNPIVTQLLSITQTGYQLNNLPPAAPTYDRNSFPPIEFTYSQPVIDPTVYEVDPASLENLPSGMNQCDQQWIDLDGEGLVGLLYRQMGGFYYKRNLSPLTTVIEQGISQCVAQFGAVEAISSNPAVVAQAAPPQFFSLAGDGRQDLVNFRDSVRGYYARTEMAGWDNFHPFQSFPNLEMADPNLKFVDVDGDGLIDILISEDDVFSWHRSLGDQGFGPRAYARKPYDEEQGPALIFADADQSLFLADMSGDGLTDIVRIRNGEVCYWPNLGYARFGAKVSLDNVPAFDNPEQFDPRRLRLADIDGSGTTDLIYLAANQINLYFNCSGNRLAPQQVLPGGFPATNQLSSVQVLDLLGNGTACLVWTSPLATDGGRQMRYIDLLSGQKPYLLIGMKNNLGAETRARYAPSTKFYVQDRAVGQPWITKLPFPVQVLEKLEVFDYIGRTRLSTSYRYRHGYFDGIEREFRGFGYVEQQDAESFGNSDSLFTEDTDKETDALHLAPIVTKTWYHTGAWPDVQKLLHQMSHEYYSGAALPDATLPVEILFSDGSRLPWSFSGEEQRQALRALKGSILRQEVYAADGGSLASLPYSVSERNYSLECFQPQSINPFGVFFIHARETIDHHLERDPADPRVTHDLILQINGLGQVVQSVSVAYGRNLATASVKLAPSVSPGTPPDLTLDASLYAQPEQLTALLKLSENTFSNDFDLPATYRLPGIVESSTYELTRLVRPDDSLVYTFAELQNLAQTASVIPYETVPDGTTTQKRLLTKGRTIYLRDDLSDSLPFQQMGMLGLIDQSFQLAMTGSLAEEVFLNKNSNPQKPADPAALANLLVGVGGYLHSQGDGDWWIPSSRTFYSPLPANPPIPVVQDLGFAEQNFFLPQARRDPLGRVTYFTYDFFKLLLEETQDALGNVVLVRNNYRVLQPEALTDTNSNQSLVAFDLLGMVVGTAVQGKITSGGSSESGDSFANFTINLTATEVEGLMDAFTPASLTNGLLGTATTRMIYDVNRFRTTQTAFPNDPTQWEPVFVATLARETYVNTPLPNGQIPAIQLNFSYSDGLGREVQKKIQAQPGPLIEGGPTIDSRWIGSGWTVLNNKGKPVRRYEPFFSSTHRFEFAYKSGVSSTLFYDAAQRVIATLHPDNTYEKILFSPWRQESWDANDTVLLDPRSDPDVTEYVASYFQLQPPTWQTWLQLRLPDPLTPPADSPGLPSDQACAVRTLRHAGTPQATCFDNLGRSFLVVGSNGLNKQNQSQFYPTRTQLDLDGNSLTITDPLGRTVMTYIYDQQKKPLLQTSAESGSQWSLNNILGKLIRGWDARGFLRSVLYDELQRPCSLTVDGNGLIQVCAEKTIYGDSKVGGPTQPELTNQRGRVYQSFDGTGVITNLGINPTSQKNEGYDFQGNLLRSVRQLLQDNSYKTYVNWQANPILGASYTQSGTFDALNRATQLIAPDQSETLHTYNIANLLQTITTRLTGGGGWTSFIDACSYDAKGRRTQVSYGNGTITTYNYDPVTFRLTGLQSKRTKDAAQLQGLAYTFDPVGNITSIQDSAQETVYFNGQVVSPINNYSYDPMYRLSSASGREHIGQVPASQPQYDWSDLPRINLPHPNDGQAMRLYVEQYLYDPIGNFLQVIHQAANGNWTRSYAYSTDNHPPPDNRLQSTSLPGDPSSGPFSAKYTYDSHGNMVQMPHLQSLTWNFQNELQSSQQQSVNTASAEVTYYVYNAEKQRTRKITETAQGTKKNERIYLGDFELYIEYDAIGTATLERQTLHVRDDQQRIAMVENRTQGNDGSPPQLIRFQFNNYLGSACLELDNSSKIISYEEYYPFGGSSYQAVDASIKAAAKRYRYIGKERDDETGCTYHGARYYASWLGRWISTDPGGLVDGLNLFTYCHNNPIKGRDLNGMETTDPPCPNCHTSNRSHESEFKLKASDLPPPPTPEQLKAFFEAAPAASPDAQAKAKPKEQPKPPPRPKPKEEKVALLPFFIPVPAAYIRPYQPAGPGDPNGLDAIRQMNGQPGVAVANFSRDIAPGTSVVNLTVQTVGVMAAAVGVLAPLASDAMKVAPLVTPVAKVATEAEPTVIVTRFCDITDAQTLLPRAATVSQEVADQVANQSKDPAWLALRAEWHSMGIVENSPFVSVGTDASRLATSTDPWLRTIATGAPGAAGAARAPFLLTFEVPASRIFTPANTLAVSETEKLFFGSDLLKFLISATPNPF